MKIKQLFCKHNYVFIKSKVSGYCADWLYFGDTGWYNDNFYKCTKCQKVKTETVLNERHACYRKEVENE